MKPATLIFPHQLFEKHPAVEKDRAIYLIEEFLFFMQYKFHKQKLVFPCGSMLFYEKYLRDRNYKVKYVEASVGKK